MALARWRRWRWPPSALKIVRNFRVSLMYYMISVPPCDRPYWLSCFFFVQKQPCIIIAFSVLRSTGTNCFLCFESRFLFGICEYVLRFCPLGPAYIVSCDLLCTPSILSVWFSFGICTTIYYQLDLYFYLPIFILCTNYRHSHRNNP